MYSRFTDRSRKVMQLANQEAQRFHHEYIGTEHVLLGLIKEGSGVAVHVLRALNADLQVIVSRVEALIQSRPDPATAGKFLQTPRAKKVIEYSMEEARNLNHSYVGTEHILLGLLREQEGVAALVLMDLGIGLDDARAQIALLLDQNREEFRDGRNVFWPERVERNAEPPPAQCPKCGAGQVVSVLWRGMDAYRPGKRDIETGKAIFASLSASPSGVFGPTWVCLQCTPGWAEVDQLVMQDYQLQHDKEQAVRSQDFETAAKHRDAQDVVRRRWSSVLQELLNNQ